MSSMKSEGYLTHNSIKELFLKQHTPVYVNEN